MPGDTGRNFLDFSEFYPPHITFKMEKFLPKLMLNFQITHKRPDMAQSLGGNVQLMIKALKASWQYITFIYKVMEFI